MARMAGFLLPAVAVATLAGRIEASTSFVMHTGSQFIAEQGATLIVGQPSEDESVADGVLGLPMLGGDAVEPPPCSAEEPGGFYVNETSGGTLYCHYFEEAGVEFARWLPINSASLSDLELTVGPDSQFPTLPDAVEWLTHLGLPIAPGGVRILLQSGMHALQGTIDLRGLRSFAGGASNLEAIVTIEGGAGASAVAVQGSSGNAFHFLPNPAAAVHLTGVHISFPAGANGIGVAVSGGGTVILSNLRMGPVGSGVAVAGNPANSWVAGIQMPGEQVSRGDGNTHLPHVASAVAPNVIVTNTTMTDVWDRGVAVEWGGGPAKLHVEHTHMSTLNAGVGDGISAVGSGAFVSIGGGVTIDNFNHGLTSYYGSQLVAYRPSPGLKIPRCGNVCALAGYNGVLYLEGSASDKLELGCGGGKFGITANLGAVVRARYLETSGTEACGNTVFAQGGAIVNLFDTTNMIGAGTQQSADFYARAGSTIVVSGSTTGTGTCATDGTAAYCA